MMLLLNSIELDLSFFRLSFNLFINYIKWLNVTIILQTKPHK